MHKIINRFFCFFLLFNSQLLPLADNMTKIEYYNFEVVVNGTDYVGGHVNISDNVTMVELFNLFPSSFHIERHVNYTITISVGNSFGDSQLTEPVSIGKLAFRVSYIIKPAVAD